MSANITGHKVRPFKLTLKLSIVIYALFFLVWNQASLANTSERSDNTSVVADIPLLIYVDDDDTPWAKGLTPIDSTGHPLLGDQEDLYISSAGGVGQPAGVFSLGSPSQHSTLIFEGIELRDPSLPSGGSDWSLLTNLGAVNGTPLSYANSGILQGSGSSGGLLLAIPESNDETMLLHLKATHRRYGGVLRWSPWQLPRDGKRLQTTISWLDDARISAAQKVTNTGQPASSLNLDKEFDEDRSVQVSISSVFENLYERGATKAVLLLQKQATDFDGGPGRDDPNANSKQRSIAALVTHSQKLAKALELRASLASSWGKRSTSNTADFLSTDEFVGDYRFEYQDAGVQLTAKTKAAGTATMQFWSRIQARSDKMTSDTRSSFAGFTATDAINNRISSVAGTVGGKLKTKKTQTEVEAKWTKWESAPKNALSAHIKFSARLSETQKRNSSMFLIAGQSIHNPTLFQRYSDSGNSGLQQEITRNFTAGIQNKIKSWKTRVSYTQKHLRDLIDFSFIPEKNNFGFINRSKARIEAFQISARKELTSNRGIYTSARATWLRTDQEGKRLLRRPIFQGNARIGYQFSPNHKLATSLHMIGNRSDIDTIGSSVDMETVHAWNASYEQPISNSLTCGIHIENILNQKHQLSWGYQRQPLDLQIKLSWQTRTNKK